MDLGLHVKHAIVTGGSRGIGKVIVVATGPPAGPFMISASAERSARP
jgi:NAD(P)-dependent dehydrogenase (short-subunit alcohol dehydrogenase family)